MQLPQMEILSLTMIRWQCLCETTRRCSTKLMKIQITIYLTLLVTNTTRHDISRKIALKLKLKRKERLQSTTGKISTNIKETIRANIEGMTNTDHTKEIVTNTTRRRRMPLLGTIPPAQTIAHLLTATKVKERTFASWH